MLRRTVPDSKLARRRLCEKLKPRFPASRVDDVEDDAVGFERIPRALVEFDPGRDGDVARRQSGALERERSSVFDYCHRVIAGSKYQREQAPLGRLHESVLVS